MRKFSKSKFLNTSRPDLLYHNLTNNKEVNQTHNQKSVKPAFTSHHLSKPKETKDILNRVVKNNQTHSAGNKQF